MSSPSSCPRCSRPLLLASPSGLCPECAVTAETADATPATPRPVGTGASVPTATVEPVGSTWSVAAAPAPSAQLPAAPPGYDLLDDLGHGGMGDVYLAREQASERLVAMKYVRHPGSPDALERFLIELRALVRLDHPNIVRVYASDFLRSAPFFTMEYTPGGSLAGVLKDKRTLPAAEAVRLVRTVADALAAAHAENIIHRDLKPSNILMAADGTPKVSDFGLAKRLDEVDPVTRGSGGLGTPSYMPPEQISSKNGELGPWSDVYGLGATLFHLLTGQPPYTGDSSEEVALSVLGEPVPRPRAVRPEIPMELEGIVVKCLEKDPVDRYQTMADLAADLDRFTAGQRPQAPPLTRLRRLKRWAHRNRRGVAAAAVVIGAFVLGASWPKPVPDPIPDPLREMRDDLVAGRAVHLLTPGGMPRWYEWRCAAATLAEESPPDGTCSFQSVGWTMLDLFPAPPIDRYRLSLELQHWSGPGPGGGNRTGRPSVGLYFGADSRGAGAARATSMFAVAFTDSPPGPPGADGKPLPAAVQFQPGVIVESKNANAELHWAAGGTRRFQPATGWPLPGPGAWRKVVVEVSPDRLEVLWEDAETKKLVPVMHWGARAVDFWSGEQVRDSYAGLQGLFNKSKHLAGTGATVGPWAPRMPVGVLAYGSRVKFRNVVLEPLPKP